MKLRLKYWVRCLKDFSVALFGMLSLIAAALAMACLTGNLVRYFLSGPHTASQEAMDTTLVGASVLSFVILLTAIVAVTIKVIRLLAQQHEDRRDKEKEDRRDREKEDDK